MGNKSRIFRWWNVCKETCSYFQSPEERDSNICLILFDLLKYLCFGILLICSVPTIGTAIIVFVLNCIGFALSPIIEYLFPGSFKEQDTEVRKKWNLSETESIPFMTFGYLLRGIASFYYIFAIIMAVFVFYFIFKECFKIGSKWINKMNDVNREIYNKNSI